MFCRPNLPLSFVFLVLLCPNRWHHLCLNRSRIFAVLLSESLSESLVSCCFVLMSESVTESLRSRFRSRFRSCFRNRFRNCFRNLFLFSLGNGFACDISNYLPCPVTPVGEASRFVRTIWNMSEPSL